MSRAHSLRLRLLGAMVAVFALGVGAAILSYRTEVYNITSDLRARTLENQARELLQAVRTRRDGSLEVSPPDDWRQVYSARSQQFVFTVFDAAHHPVAWSGNLPAPLPYIPVDSASRLGPVEFIGAGSARRAIVAARGPQGSTVLVARGDRDRDELVDSLFEEGSEQLTIIVPFALLGLVLIWLIAGWSLRPIARASEEAARVGPRRPEMRISPHGLPREIQPLVEAVNGALDRLSRAYATERRITADAAHELRTPLAVLNLRLQRAKLTGKTDWGAVERELAQMGRLVDQLLDLARKESLARERQSADLPLINLSRVVREAAATVLPLTEAAGRELEIDVPDAVQVRGNSDDLRDMVRNLLENALVHGRGKVSARITDGGKDGAEVTIEVTDEGAGVPAGHEDAIFQRFRRLNADTPGSGLGLAIVRHVARSHGGEASFAAGIARAVVHLPAVAAASPGPQSRNEPRDSSGERARDPRADRSLQP